MPKQNLRDADKAIALQPDDAASYRKRGDALHALKRFDEAIASYDHAIALRPDYVEAYSNRGVALKELKRFDEAIASYDKAIALRPDLAQLYGNRGNALQELERLDEAVASYDTAIALKPDYAEAYNNRGVALNVLGRFEPAFASYDTALALKPDYAEARWNRGLAYLLTGRFDTGWRDYEARKTKKEPVGNRAYAQPLWLGDADISGKTILVHWEQGFGDTIQFCRYVKWIEDAGATVLFGPQRPLKALMRGLDAAVQLVDVDDAALKFDFHCPLMSLPLAFNTGLATIPSGKTYLGVGTDKIRAWRDRLGEKNKLRIGVVWSGGSTHKNDRNRSIGLETFRCLFDERFQFVSLQKDVRDTDGASLATGGIAHFGDDLDDFSDTAALCSLMDLVISVDTGVAHLAGALGKPVWVLLPLLPDWRWMLDRDDSPWYPSMRLFRQKSRGDWNGVLRQVGLDLNVFSKLFISSSVGPAD